MAFLEVDNIDARYGRINALTGVSLHVDEGEIVTLIGANGAGKTTTLRSISGLVKIVAGSIRFQGKDLGKSTPDQIVRLGVGHSPEGRRVFPRMTVRENLELGAYTRTSKKESADDMEQVLTTFPRLKERFEQKAGTMSGGEQQMLAMGRALMSRPKVLLLDEPSLGLSPLLVQTIFGVIKDINKRGTTVLLIEQNARQALAIASRGYVLEVGKIAFSGPSAELMSSEAVQDAYLGGAA
jgi:branched-chain amino acid transport system ATP-binding protein